MSSLVAQPEEALLRHCADRWTAQRLRFHAAGQVLSANRPTEAGAIEKADAVPVTLLVGGLMTTHLYREDRIVYGNGPEQLGTYEFQRWPNPPRR